MAVLASVEIVIAMHEACERPELIMPGAEAELARILFQRAPAILEYGMGGSTLLAAEMPDKRIQSVESDARFVSRMKAWFGDHPPASMPLLYHANIGPTRKWGYPADDTSFRLWPQYAQGIWDHPGFVAPDVVLIDGRFRLACLLTVALRTRKPVSVMVDDYIDRPDYHDAEEMLGRPEFAGRMAKFELVPGMISMDRLQLVIDSHMRPL